MVGFQQPGAYWDEETEEVLTNWPPTLQRTEPSAVNLDYFDFGQPMPAPPYPQASSLPPQQSGFDIPASTLLYSSYANQSQPTQQLPASSWDWNGYIDTVRPGQYLNQHHPNAQKPFTSITGSHVDIPAVEEGDPDVFGLITYPSNTAGTSPAPLAPAPLHARANVSSTSSGRAPTSFANFAEARQWRERIRETMTHQTVPDDVRTNAAAYVSNLSAAMKDLSDANDDRRTLDDGSNVRPSPAFTRLRDVQYIEADLQSACWLILDCMIDLHENGCRLEASSQFPLTASNAAHKDDKDLTFEERFEAVTVLLRCWKLCCMDAIQDDQTKIMALVRAPYGINTQKSIYQRTNDERKKSKNDTDKALGRTPNTTPRDPNTPPRRRRSSGTAMTPTARPRLTSLRTSGLLASSISTPPRRGSMGSTLAADPSTPTGSPLVRRTTRGISKRSYKEPSDEEEYDEEEELDSDGQEPAGKRRKA